MGGLACRLALLRDHRQHLQGRDQPVAGGAEIGQHDVAGLLAAYVVKALLHFLDDVTVADLRARQLEVQRFEIAVEPGVRHHRADDAATLERPRLVPGMRDQSQNLVSVDDVAAFVGHHHAVRVAVERNAKIGTHLAHLPAHRVGRSGTAFEVDVCAVRLDAKRNDVGAQFPQHRGRHLVGSPVRAIDDDAQAVQPEIAREDALGEFDIAGMGIVDALGAADLRSRRQPLFHAVRHQTLDLLLAGVGELLPVGSEQLDAVVGVGIVGRRYHHTQIGAQRARQHGDGRRRQRSEQEHVHADGGEARHQCGFDHIAGKPRVLADHHAMAIFAAREDAPRRHADLHGDLGSHREAVGEAAYAVRAEEFAIHGILPNGPSSGDPIP